ncbi:outer membrane protein assembly factor BamD [Corallococcus sp. M34]|uniref:outer membrane protein assembly factor BamD n=1 Tax=Citreicoccus inhibens TaxID=2849499 RepID=UPI001C228FC0|nr:outer membrane protein assembly factor BamD [Citreicoccus inhibens]MBU8900829.1 outer membrane protein assembly factor BamD [Citreicoccus inhibens]
MSPPEPVRLLAKDSEASLSLRELLTTALRSDEPTAEQLASLSARVMPPPAASTGTPSPTSPPSGALGSGVASGAVLKVVMVGVAAVTGVVGSFQAGRLYERERPQVSAPAQVSQRAPEVAPPSPPLAPAEPEPVPSTASVPPRPPVPAPLKPSPLASSRHEPVSPPVAEPALTDAELALLDAAQRSLQRGDAAAALAELSTHATRFPNGALEQEREVLAIEALWRLGERHAARERARGFAQHFPTSSHLVRLQAILAPDSP